MILALLPARRNVPKDRSIRLARGGGGALGGGGQVRVNYYVRELFGDPDVYHDAWAAPFGVLAMKAPTSLFVHPVVEKVLRGLLGGSGSGMMMMVDCVRFATLPVAHACGTHYSCGSPIGLLDL